MQRVLALLDKTKKFYDNGDPSHDFLHIRRVMKTCERLAREENASVEIVLAAAILHDVVNVPKNHPDRTRASEMAAAKARELLSATGFSEKEIVRITAAVKEHSYSAAHKPSSIESAILQDADKLDALGAIGIMRTVTCGSKIGSNYYNDDEPLAKTRELNDKSHTLDHFYVKLFKLPELMNTPSARLEADKRVQFMHNFIAQFESEIS